MTVMFQGPNEDVFLHLSNGGADALLKSIGHPGLGAYTSGSMPVCEARRLISELGLGGSDCSCEPRDIDNALPALIGVVEALEAAGLETLEWA